MKRIKMVHQNEISFEQGCNLYLDNYIDISKKIGYNNYCRRQRLYFFADAEYVLLC